MKSVQITKDNILVDNKPVRLISGAMHYFRVHPELWRDRLEKARAMGLNTIETYVSWNLHEPVKGQFDFSGFLDLEKYIEQVAEMGMMMILRPGPFICAEWEFGGFPGWLSTVPGIRFRCSNQPYMQQVEDFYNELLPRLKRFQWTNGGPVIAIQIENEYGSYGQDKTYLSFIKELYEKHGFDIPYFTSDGPEDGMLQGGTLPGIWKTANFGSRPKDAFEKLRDYEDGQMMCMEFWNGWFDHWGTEHHTRDAEDAAACLDEMLTMGAHVNFYMFHGGTNFGFMNGANCHDGVYCPTINSYDYDSPLSEAGDLTPKYEAFKKVIGKHFPECYEICAPPNSKKHGYGTVKLSKSASLFDCLEDIGAKHSCVAPECMEAFGQNYGFILYSKKLTGPVPNAKLTIQNPRDRAVILVDKKEYAVVYRNDATFTVDIDIPAEGLQLDILVENMGRVNFGDNLPDSQKGITEGVRINGQFQFGWDIQTLPMDDLEKVSFSDSGLTEGPAFYQGEFEAKEACDTFLKVPNGTKGICWINGFNLGRYWEIGPQKTLYIPAPLLKQGRNEITVFEIHSMKEACVELLDKPDLG